ncbi:hypothetical protein N7530_005524 [Penicillium desertorum]|uniref:Uncharacterized protein n=1 Tax=Penicillium desertorum TaxID=1303715 RepID=A0A9W9X087_9EURO|nr:hypothetical protein N7530_005524 [Penicillium desertorum]
MESPPSHSLLFLLLIASTVATSTTRYTVPIPESMDVLETRRELNEMAEQYPLSTVGARNGGWYILDHDGTLLAVATDSVCEELDASIEEAMRLHGLPREPDNQVSKGVIPRNDQRPGSGISNSCSHPRCLASSACRTYSNCYVCEWDLGICI